MTVGNGFSGVTDDTSFTTILQRNVFRTTLPHVDFIPSALDGVDTAYAIKRFDRMVTRLDPNHVVIMLGLNDAKPKGRRPPLSPSQYSANLSLLVELCLAIDAKPVLSSPNPRLDLYRRRGGIEDIMEAYAEATLEISSQYHIVCINVYDRFVHNGHFQQLLPDGLHPSADGQRLIAEAYAETMIPLLTGGIQSADSTVERPFFAS